MLLCHLLNWNLDDVIPIACEFSCIIGRKAYKKSFAMGIKQISPPLGHIVENFVATELLKLLSFSNIRSNLLHFRTSDDKEVNFVLERPDGSLAGIEVKASYSVDTSNFRGLKALQEVTKKDFVCGVVLYTGKDIVPFGDKLFAVPLATLW